LKRLFFLIQVFFISYSYAQTNNYTVRAEIKGTGNDTVYVWYYPLSNIKAVKRDTILAKDNVFTYKLPINEPSAIAILPKKSWIKKVSYMYMPQTRFIELFVSPNDRIQIKGVLNKYYLDYKVIGSILNQDYSKFKLSYKAPAIEAVKLELQIDSLSQFEGKKKEVDELFDRRGKQFSEITNAKLQFIDQNLNNNITAYILSRLPLDTFAEYYPKLTSSVQNGMFNALLKHTYQTYLDYTSAKKADKELTQGKQAPAFSLKGTDDTVISLADFKGKFIVLDFWGTWCSPCVQELPTLKSYYEKYKSEINFVGIACKENKITLEKAISEYQLGWTQLINSNENDVSLLYGVQSFPTKIILDKDLKIIKRFTGVDEDFYKTLDGLIKSNN